MPGGREGRSRPEVAVTEGDPHGISVGLVLVAVLIAMKLRSRRRSRDRRRNGGRALIGATIGTAFLGARQPWITSAPAQVDCPDLPGGCRAGSRRFPEALEGATEIGLIGFVPPFLGCCAVAQYMLHWQARPSWLAGVAPQRRRSPWSMPSCSSWSQRDTFGKAILAACFVNDLGTVIALGLIFAPFTVRSAASMGFVIGFAVLPWLTPRFFKRYGGRVSELEAEPAAARWNGRPCHLVGRARPSSPPT